MFSLAAQYGWQIITSGVTSAFLQSDKLDREVYVQPPADIRTPGKIWLLQKPMYGLDDSGLKWYQTVDSKLRKLGCNRLHTDLAVFSCDSSSIGRNVGRSVGRSVCRSVGLSVGLSATIEFQKHFAANAISMQL